MNKDKKLLLLLAPLVFMVVEFVPVMIYDIVPSACMQKVPFLLLYLFWLVLGILGCIWYATFYYIPIGLYIGILIVYTVISWTWILWQKKGNAIYFIIWFVLGVLSILMYWKWGELYYILLNA